MYMKRQIRFGIFEANSSSTHNLFMCSKDDFENWKLGRLYFNSDSETFSTREEVIKKLKDFFWDCVIDWENEEAVDAFIDFSETFYTYDGFFQNNYYETFCKEREFSGTNVVAFGYYGWDG